MSVLTKKQRNRDLWVVWVDSVAVGEVYRNHEGFHPGVWLSPPQAGEFRFVRGYAACKTLKEAAQAVSTLVQKRATR